MERLHWPALSGPAVFDHAARLLAVAFALAATVLAGKWLSELTAPRPVAELPVAASVEPVTGTGAIGRLFASGDVQSDVLEGLLLTGVFSGTRGGGFATIRTRAGDVHVFRGDEVAPGVTLKQIEGNRVILLVSGIEKELKLAESSAVPPQVPPRPPLGVAIPPQAQGQANPVPQPQPVEPERQ